MLDLRSNEIHIWITDPDRVMESGHYARLYTLLSATERERYHRFKFDKDRLLYLVAHAQVRTILSLYADLPAYAWEFRENPYGRPEISNPGYSTSLYFNLSHTEHLTACVAARKPEVGIDVEKTTRQQDLLDVAKMMFAPREYADLLMLPESERQRRFFQIWTLKEAYIKARGMGLSIPLDQFWFRLDPQTIRVQFEAGLNDTPEHWQFEMFEPTPVHQMAVAVNRQTDPSMQMQVRHIVP